MKWLISLLAVLGLSVGIAWWALQDPGFVVIGRGGMVLETSLSVFGFLLLLAFFVFYLLLRLLIWLWGLPERLQAGSEVRRQEKRYQSLVQGLAALSEGYWKRAEQALLRGTPESAHYLFSAYAAQQRGEQVPRDEHLAAARQDLEAEYLLPARLFEARLYLEQGQTTDALGLLTELHGAAPRHPRVLALLQEAYERQQSWGNLYKLLPELRKRKVISAQQMQELEARCINGLLRQAAAQGGNALDATWNNLLKLQRLNPRVAALYARHLVQRGQHDSAEAVLRESIKHHWHAQTVRWYSLVEADPAQQLNHAEKWLKGHEQDPVLLLTLGRLCMRNRLWGKSLQYLETSLHLRPAPETYQVLGELQTQIGEMLRAADYYLKGLQLVQQQASDA